MSRPEPSLPGRGPYAEADRVGSDGAPVSVLRILSTNSSSSTDGRNLDDTLYLNDRILDAKNEWLYHFYMIVQEPQKRLQIYKKTSQKLVFLCEPYARFCLSLDLSDFIGDDYREHASNVMDARVWYQSLYKSMLEWSSWDLVTLLVKAMTVRDALGRFYTSRPYGIRWMENEEGPLQASTSSSIPQSFDDFSPELEELTDAIRNALSSKDEAKTIIQLKNQEAESFINLLDSVMDILEPDDRLRNKCYAALRRLCGEVGMLPGRFILPTKKLKKQTTHPLSSCGYADIWRGSLEEQEVALKVFRIFQEDDLRAAQKIFCKEAVLWRRLSHPNITPFLGVNTELFEFCIVSEWMPNGDINTYLRQNSAANRLELLVDIARGLEYLHSIGVLHGNLKGANILINSRHHACLSDFGLTSVNYDTSTVNLFASSTTAPSLNHSVRYTAPELLHPDHSGLDMPLPTPQSDVYALAMVMWEVFTGRPPFFEYPRESTVVLRVMMGMRPGESNVEGTREPPEGAQDVGLGKEVWALMEVCWRAEWPKRPLIPIVRALLEEAERAWVPPLRGPARWPLLNDMTSEARRAKQDEEIEDEGPRNYTLPQLGEAEMPSFPDTMFLESSIASLKRKFEDAPDIFINTGTSDEISELVVKASAGQRRASTTEVQIWDSLDGDVWHRGDN